MEKIKNFFFKNTGTKQTVVKNTFWLFFAEIGVRLLKLIIFIYAARVLGVSEWGVFSYAFALMSVFAVFADIGINAVITREAAKNNDHTPLVATGFFLKVILSIVTSLALLSTILLVKDDPTTKSLIIIMTVILFLDSMREFGYNLNRAVEKMEIEAMGKIIPTIILVIAGIIFIHYDKTALSLGYAYALSSFVALIMMYINIKSNLKSYVNNFNKKLLVPLFHEAWPLAIVSVFGVLLSNADTVILGWFKSSTEVGLYAAAQKPIQIIYLIPSLISIALLPTLTRLSSIDKEKMRIGLGKAINTSFVIALPLAVGALLLGNQFIVLLFGSAFIKAGSIFAIMTAAVVVTTPGVIISDALFTEGKQKKTAVAIVIGTIANILLSFTLIPSLGMYGAAIAATVAQFVSNGYIIYISRTIPAIRFSLHINKIVIASVGMAVLIFLLRSYIPFVPLTLLSVITYVIILFLLKEKTLKDVKSALTQN
jgi:O-antigen/teichoic acid export membrane protein